MKECFVLPVSNDSYAAHREGSYRGDAHRECSRANLLSREKLNFTVKLFGKLRLETLSLKFLQPAIPDQRPETLI